MASKSVVYGSTGTSGSNAMAARKEQDQSEWERLLKFAASNAANMDTGTMLGYGLGRLLRTGWDNYKKVRKEKKEMGKDPGEASGGAIPETPSGSQLAMAQIINEDVNKAMGDFSKATGYYPFDTNSIADGYFYGQTHPGFWGTTASRTENSATDADGNSVSSTTDSVTPFGSDGSALGQAMIDSYLANRNGGAGDAGSFGIGNMADSIAGKYGITDRDLLGYLMGR